MTLLFEKLTADHERIRNVKTVRFAKVIAHSGVPEFHLVLMEPAKDRALQTAVKAHRVMTMYQESTGTKADRGEIGFHPGPGRQYLLFPQSLKSFEDRAVVGIKYDLINSPEIPRSQRAKAPQPAKSRKQKPKAQKPEKKAEAPGPKIVAFKPPSEPEAEPEEDDEVADLKKQVRHAMKVLEEGKPVAAFNLLKRIVGDS
jgi:hypothetical protein